MKKLYLWQKLAFSSMLYLMIFCLVLLTSVNANAANTLSKNLQLQIDKLHNQVNYLISAENKNHNAALTEQLNVLRGEIQSNRYQLERLSAANEALKEQLQTMVDKFETLKQTLNQPTKKETRLKADDAAFEKAQKSLLAKHYKTAETQLKQYLKDYYHGEHYSESLYLLGQIYLITGKTDQAYQQFKTIATRYPKSIKIADAQYNLGLLEIAKGNIKQGNNYLNQVIKQYPNTEAALKAKQQIMPTKD